jgi:hypothetical protein
MRERRVPMSRIARRLNRTTNALYAFLRDERARGTRIPPLQPKRSLSGSERLRDATLIAIANYGNDNGLDFDTAARRLISGVR